MDDTVLVIVDMQDGQSSAFDPNTLRGVCREVETAKRNQRPIVILEFPHALMLRTIRGYAEANGKSLPIGRAPVAQPLTRKEILDAIGDYDRFAVRNKFDFDGSAEVFYACHDMGWPKTSFRVIGVQTFSCVMATAHGLLTLNPLARVEVVQDACGHDGNPDLWHRFLEEIHLLPTA